MPVGIGASSIMGLAHETTPGTYVAPLIYAPYTTEGLKYTQDTIQRRPVRGSADLIGVINGNSQVGGDIEAECTEDILAFFLYTARYSVAKTGAGPFVYTFTPNANAVPARTMSITVVRNGIVFGYVGCVVTAIKITTDDTGYLMMTLSVMGLDEAVQSAPTATWPTTVPFGPGQYDIEVPTTTQVFDIDTFEFNVDDSGNANPRLDSTRAIAFINYGERTVTLTASRDFITRTDYDAFKALTVQAIKIAVSKGATGVVINFNGAVKDTYEVNIGNQGDLVRAQIAYFVPIDSSGISHTLVCTTALSIT